MTDLAYDDRAPYMPPGGAPKPPPHIWAELENAGREAGTNYATDPRYLAAHAQYLAWLHDQGIEGRPDPLHGHAPTEVDDEGVPF